MKIGTYERRITVEPIRSPVPREKDPDRPAPKPAPERRTRRRTKTSV